MSPPVKRDSNEQTDDTPSASNNKVAVELTKYLYRHFEEFTGHQNPPELQGLIEKAARDTNTPRETETTSGSSSQMAPTISPHSGSFAFSGTTTTDAETGHDSQPPKKSTLPYLKNKIDGVLQRSLPSTQDDECSESDGVSDHTAPSTPRDSRESSRAPEGSTSPSDEQEPS